MATKEQKRSKSDSKESKRVKTDADADANAELTPTTTPSKRKASVEELEVNLEAPEPPSKRAKRALKKGKSAGKTREDKDDADLTKDDTGKEDGGKEERGEHGVWIGNMPWFLTQDELKEWLVQNSGGVLTTESITRVKMPLTKDNRTDKMRNKGFAYVDFSELGEKLSAVALSETDLNGRKLLIKDSTSFEGRPQKEAEPEPVTMSNGQEVDQKKAFRQENNACRKIFVGNMSFQTTEEDVRRNFEKCGEIEFIKVATFEDSGKCKGFGWVRFAEPDAAAWAVKGFVKIKQEIETEDDFKEGSDDEEDDGEKKERQYKTRKWWVNRMVGRELKIELAEDDQTRYRKRFGKDAPKDEDGNKIGRPSKKSDDGSKPAAKPMKESTNIDVARLKGTVVKSTGTKVTFD